MKKILWVFIFLCVVFASCNNKIIQQEYSISGTVVEIEPGKDGYTASIRLEKGEIAHAVISRVNMGAAYKSVKLNKHVVVYGTKIEMDSSIWVKATRVVEDE